MAEGPFVSQLQGRGERQKDKYERRLLRAFCLAPKLDRLALRLNHLSAPKIITTIEEKFGALSSRPSPFN